MGPGYGFMDPGFVGWMTLGSLIFWLGIGALVVFAIVRLTRPVDRRGDPQAMLDERLARGEINEEEYRSRRTLLTGR